MPKKNIDLDNERIVLICRALALVIQLEEIEQLKITPREVELSKELLCAFTGAKKVVRSDEQASPTCAA